MTNGAVTSPQNEAITFLSDALLNLTSPNKDLKSILRKCQHVCELLGWDQQKKWFYQELNGYYKDSTLPPYRKISGTRKWDISGSWYDEITWASGEMAYGVDPAIYEAVPDTLEVWTGIDWFIGASQTGYRELLEDTKNVQSPSKRKIVTLQRVRVFAAPAINASLSQIEKNIFDFVSSTCVQLKYSNVIKSIWTDYQIQVDRAISQLGLNQHLLAIEDNLQSNNSETWRVAVFECRNLLNDLANHLWRDTRNRYEHLNDGKLDVSQGKFANRLAAYLHQKGIAGTQGKYMRDEIYRLAAAIRSLISYQSEAHEAINLQTARSVAIASYVLIGEIVTRTDLIPIDVYKEPAVENGAS